MICIFTHSIYGISGNELPPKCTKTVHYAETSYYDEKFEDFMSRMVDLGMEVRRELESKPIEPYSSQDKFSWGFYDEKKINLTEILKA